MEINTFSTIHGFLDNIHGDSLYFYICLYKYKVIKLDNTKTGIPSQGAKVDLDLWPCKPK